MKIGNYYELKDLSTHFMKREMELILSTQVMMRQAFKAALVFGSEAGWLGATVEFFKSTATG